MKKVLLAAAAIGSLLSSASGQPYTWAESSDDCITRNVEAGNTGPSIQCHDYVWNRETGTAILMCKGHLGGGEGTEEDRNVGGCRVVDEEQEARLEEKCGVTECRFKAELELHSKIVRIVGPVEYVTKRCHGRLIRKTRDDVGPVIQVGDDPECTFGVHDQPVALKTGDYILKTCKPDDVCDLNVAVSDDYYDGVLVGPVHRVK
jgi:hypothetical protein